MCAPIRPATKYPATASGWAQNVKLGNNCMNEHGEVDFQFRKTLDDEGYEAFLKFLDEPSPALIKKVVKYQPAASFGFVSTHVFDGLDDDGSVYDADEDYIPVMFPSNEKPPMAGMTKDSRTRKETMLKRGWKQLIGKKGAVADYDSSMKDISPREKWQGLVDTGHVMNGGSVDKNKGKNGRLGNVLLGMKRRSSKILKVSLAGKAA